MLRVSVGVDKIFSDYSIIFWLEYWLEVEGNFELTAIARPSCTEMKTTPKNAQSITRKSNLSIFQIWWAAGISIRPTTAVTMIAPSTTFGVYWNRGMRKRRVTMTVTDITTLDTAVFAPALWLTAEREKAPEIQSTSEWIFICATSYCYCCFSEKHMK